jgi:hypothetical protein
MAGIYDVTLAPGVAANIPVLGDYIKVRSAPFGLVEIKLDGGEAYLLDEGLGVRLPEGKTFRDVQIKNKAATAQTVLLFIGNSRFEDSRITGRVSIYENVSAQCQVIAQSNVAITAVTATALIAPATNVAGITIRQASCEAKAGLAGSQTTAQLVAAPTAPLAANPTGTTRLLICNQSDSDASYKVQSVFNFNRRIPPGWGIYYVCATATTIAINNGVSVSFEVES